MIKMLLFLLICLLLLCQVKTHTSYSACSFSSNFNRQKICQHEFSPISLQQPLILPIILTNPNQYKSKRPLFQKYPLRKYQLYDTNYLPDLSKISRLDEELAYNMEPPIGVFQETGNILIDSYRLLENKQFKVTLVNPSQRFRFCVEDIFIDSDQILRLEKRPLPFCINSTTKYPFFFSLYITEHKPLKFKGTIYFIITVYDGNELVDQKIWPKQINVKVTHNHLRIVPLQIRNWHKQTSIVMIRNPQKHDLSLVIIYKRKLYQLTGQPIDGNIIIPSLKNYKFIIDGKDSKMTIYTKSLATDIIYPVLYVPIYCLQELIIDYFNIGILADDRSLLEFPLTVTSYANTTIHIREIHLRSSTQTVQLLPLTNNYPNNYVVQPNLKHYKVANIVIHGSRKTLQREFFEVTIKYLTQQLISVDSGVNSSSKTSPHLSYHQCRTNFHYSQMRSPISVGSKRFIDISKLESTSSSVSQNAFPIRNNLNLPIILNRVIYDQTKFKLLWLQDKRDYIFPNHQRQEFSLQYIGTRNIGINPIRFIALFQFNGNLFVPLEIVVYDKTLQCLIVTSNQINNRPQRCAELPIIQFGYFNQPSPQGLSDVEVQSINRRFSSQQPSIKTKQLIIRNWNPQSKTIKVGVQVNSIEKFGFNCTVNVLGPYPQYELAIKSTNNLHQLYLKGNHFIILQISLCPLSNATSGTLPLRIITGQQHITKIIRFKIQNGTIALIPQISRFQSTYKKTIQYLNLVSTYKQSYKIKQIRSNLSSVSIFCNNLSQIHQNQWIGMAIIYQPFINQWNVTSSCCGLSYLNQLLVQLITPNKPIPALITLITTTQLQTNATVLIDRNSQPIIQIPYYQQFTIREKFRKDAQRVDINLIETARLDKFTYKLTLTNVFQDNLKGNLIMLDQQLIQRLDQYMDYKKRLSRKVTTHFCLRNDVKVKHNFSPSLIKQIFHLQQNPLQITVQPLTNTSFYINSPVSPREQVLQGKHFSQYFKQTINSGSRMCYRFQTSIFIKNFIQTGVVNWFSQQYRIDILSQFIKREFQQLQKFQKETNHNHNHNHNQYNQNQNQYNQNNQNQNQNHNNNNNNNNTNNNNNNNKDDNINNNYNNNNNNYYINNNNSNKDDNYSNHNNNNHNYNYNYNYHSNNNNKDNIFNLQKLQSSQQRGKYHLQYDQFYFQHYVDKDHFCKSDRNLNKMTSFFRYCQHINIKMKFNSLKDQTIIIKEQECFHTANSQQQKYNRKECKMSKQGNKRVKRVLQKQINQYFLLGKNDRDHPNDKNKSIQIGFQIYPVKNRAPILAFSPINQFNQNSHKLIDNPSQASKQQRSQANQKLRKKNQGRGISSEQAEQPLILTNPSFYVILLNNFTSYQLYHKTIQISKPKLRIKNIIIENKRRIAKSQFEARYFNTHKNKQSKQTINQNKVLPIYIDEFQIKLKKYEINNLPNAKLHNTSIHQNKVLKNLSINQHHIDPQSQQRQIKQLLLNGQFGKLIVKGRKSFQLANEGQAQISYSHIGFQRIQKACSHQGIKILAGPCDQSLSQQDNNSIPQSFQYIIRPQQAYPISIDYQIPLYTLLKQKQHTTSLYLYHQQSYHIELIIKFKLSDELLGKYGIRTDFVLDYSHNKQGSKLIIQIWNILLNICAFAFMLTVILLFKEDQTRDKLKQLNNDNIGSSKQSRSQWTNISSSIYQRALKRSRAKSQPLNSSSQWASQSNPLYPSQFTILQPSLYPFTIGSPIPPSKSSQSLYHPIVNISQQILDYIKKQEKKNTKILHKYFNESEQSQILVKNQHQLVDNISALTINFDQQEDKQYKQPKNQHINEHMHNAYNKDQGTHDKHHQHQIFDKLHTKDQVIQHTRKYKTNISNSQDSSFDFQIARSRNQDQIRNSSSQDSQHQSGFSQASQSDLPDGVQIQVTDQILNQSNSQFGFASEAKKVKDKVTKVQVSEEKTNESYYNLFSTSNPLKKGQKSPFSWMNENKKKSRLKW